MLKFTSEQDLTRLLKKDNPAYPVIARLIQGLITDTYGTEYPYQEESDGFISYIEPSDVDRPLTEIWGDDAYRLTEVPWEGITKQQGVFLAVFLANNQYGIVFVIPDEDWVTGKLRECILRNLDSPEEIERQQSIFEQEET